MSEARVRNSRGNGWSRGLALTWLVVAALVVLPIQAQAEVRGQVTNAIGKVEIGRGEPPTFEMLKKGVNLSAGDVVRTGRGGRVELKLGAGTVRVYENSLLRIPTSSKSGHQMELTKGRSIFDVIKESVKDRFEIKTPEVVVSVKGTRFEVDLRGELTQVAVFHGTVGLRSPEASLELETLVRQGFAASGAANVPFELDLTPRSDPWDTWAKLSLEKETAANVGRETRERQLHRAAKASAHNASAKQLVEIASKRNPEIARKVAKIRKDRMAALETGASEKSGDVPAAPADVMSTMKPGRQRSGGRPMRFSRNMPMDINPNDLAPKTGREHDALTGPQLPFDDEMSAGGVVSEPDPTGSTAGGWDPTPELSMMEMAQLNTGMSYQQLIQIWYESVEALMLSHPQVFTGANAEQYQAALTVKLIALGLSPNAAQNFSSFIASQIQNN